MIFRYMYFINQVKGPPRMNTPPKSLTYRRSEAGGPNKKDRRTNRFHAHGHTKQIWLKYLLQIELTLPYLADLQL